MPDERGIGDAFVRLRIDTSAVERELDEVVRRHADFVRRQAAEETVRPEPHGFETHSVGGEERIARDRFARRTGSDMLGPAGIEAARPELQQAAVPPAPPAAAARPAPPVRTEVPAAGRAVTGILARDLSGTVAGRALRVGRMGMLVAATAARPGLSAFAGAVAGAVSGVSGGGAAARGAISVAAIVAAVEASIRIMLPSIAGFIEGIVRGRTDATDFSALIEGMNQRIVQIENRVAGMFVQLGAAFRQETVASLMGGRVEQAGLVGEAVRQAWEAERHIEAMFSSPVRALEARAFGIAVRRTVEDLWGRMTGRPGR